MTRAHKSKGWKLSMLSGPQAGMDVLTTLVLFYLIVDKLEGLGVMWLCRGGLMSITVLGAVLCQSASSTVLSFQLLLLIGM